MNATVAAQITQIGETQSFGSNGFEKKEIILKTIEEFPNFYCVEFQKQNIELLNGFQVGQNVKVNLNIRGREYTNPDTGNYTVFHALVGWKIEQL